MSLSRVMTIAGCVPAYNNESTIAAAVASLKAQSIPLDDIFVVDDGSTDATAKVAMEAGARVVSMGSNQGRGAARARAIEETQAGLLLSVDGTNALAPDFLEKCRPWFEESDVAAVYGRINQLSPTTAVDRWRGRHLYKTDEEQQSTVVDHLATGGFCQRVATINAVGNFSRTCRHSEDAEMGQRLLLHHHKIVFEAGAILTTLTSNSLKQVFERYWRWHAGVSPRFQPVPFIRFWWYTLKVLVPQDLRQRDLASATFSMLLPYYYGWRTMWSR